MGGNKNLQPEKSKNASLGLVFEPVNNLTLGIDDTVLSETALSFLGFGVKPPDVSLGSLLADGSSTISSAPWLFAYPAGLLVVLTVSVMLIGDGLRDALDPTSSSGGRG